MSRAWRTFSGERWFSQLGFTVLLCPLSDLPYYLLGFGQSGYCNHAYKRQEVSNIPYSSGSEEQTKFNLNAAT